MALPLDPDFATQVILLKSITIVIIIFTVFKKKHHQFVFMIIEVVL